MTYSTQLTSLGMNIRQAVIISPTYTHSKFEITHWLHIIAILKSNLLTK